MFEVITKTYSAPPFNIREALRYAGCGKDSHHSALAEDCFREADPGLRYCICFTTVPVKVSEDTGDVDLGFTVWHSRNLAKNLRGCTEAVIFAATVGLELDRLIARYSRTSPSRAVILQGIGAERIEALCDEFERDMLSGRDTRPRFSPGYGDLPLEAGRDIFALLTPSRRIGLSMTESLLMTPTKSVTAIVGVVGDE